MNEQEEIKMRTVFFHAILDFFDEREELSLDMNVELDFSDFSHELTDKLIEAYEISKQLDRDRTHREESI